MYRYPTPLTAADERLTDFYHAVKEEYARKRAGSGSAMAGPLPAAGAAPPDFLMELMHALSRNFTYAPGSTGAGTAASAAFAGGRGVCQDYAHIFIALCRLAGYPARYVAGMTPGEGATHAWVEVLLGGRWISFDPTRDRLSGRDRIKLSHGRDFGDCSVNRGCFLGGRRQRQRVSVKVEEISE